VTAVQDILRDVDSPLDALTSLAAGADQLVATERLRAGARLHVIVPSRNYERTFAAGEDLACFRSLLEAAHAVTRLDYAEPSEEAFLAPAEASWTTARCRSRSGTGSPRGDWAGPQISFGTRATPARP
jgi:hypothetical protein